MSGCREWCPGDGDAEVCVGAGVEEVGAVGAGALEAAGGGVVATGVVAAGAPGPGDTLGVGGELADVLVEEVVAGVVCVLVVAVVDVVDVVVACEGAVEVVVGPADVVV
jgi:hypothetical protein